MKYVNINYFVLCAGDRRGLGDWPHEAERPPTTGHQEQLPKIRSQSQEGESHDLYPGD